MKFFQIFTCQIALVLGLLFSFQGTSPVVAQDNARDIFEKALEGLLRGGKGEPGTRNSNNPPEAVRVPASRAEIQLSFAPLVKKVSGSVVNVYAARRAVAVSPFAGDPFFERFFGGRSFNRPRNQN